jgi:hypothetical protein
MLEILALIVVVQVLPIMVAARVMGVGKPGFLRCVAAAVILATLAVLVDQFAANVWIGAAVAAVVGAVLMAGLMDTTVLKGFGVGVTAVLVKILVLRAVFEYYTQGLGTTAA